MAITIEKSGNILVSAYHLLLRKMGKSLFSLHPSEAMALTFCQFLGMSWFTQWMTVMMDMVKFLKELPLTLDMSLSTVLMFQQDPCVRG